MKTKEKGIDLGALQADFEEAKKTNARDKKAMEKAGEAFEASRKWMVDSHDRLVKASKAVSTI